MAEGGVLDPPACLDVCALYGRSNPALVARLLGSLGGLDGGSVGVRLAEGLEASGLAAARALAEVHAKVGVGNRVSPGGLCRNCLGGGESCFFLCWGCVLWRSPVTLMYVWVGSPCWRLDSVRLVFKDGGIVIFAA